MPLEPEASAERERRVGQVLAEYFAAVDSGQAPDRQALLARHPELAAELAGYFEQQDRFRRLVEPLRPVAATTGPGCQTATDVEATGEHLSPRAGPPELTRAGDPSTLPTPSSPTHDPAETDEGDERGGGNGDGHGGTGDGDEDYGGSERPRGTGVRYFGDYELK